MVLLRAILVILPFAAYYLYTWLRWWRLEKFKAVPQMPLDFVWGHMKLINERSTIPGRQAGRNSDDVFEDMYNEIGRPGVILFDTRPVIPPILMIGSHQVAEQISQPSKSFRYSVFKSPTVGELNPLVGTESILTRENEDWKQLRKQFNSGFQPAHLMTLLPQILEKTAIFLNRIDSYAASGATFKLDDLCVDLTFDIIGAVVMDVAFNAQDRANEHPIATKMRGLLKVFAASSVFARLWPPTRVRRIVKGRQVDAAIKDAVKLKFAEHTANLAASKGQFHQSGRSVIALSFEGENQLTPHLLQQITDQIKTFLFAGHDTTAVALQWAFYELSRTPNALAKIRKEIDSVFGAESDCESVAEQILERGEEALQKLSYTSAVIKEILRLYPPAGSARMAPPGSNFMLHLPNGTDICVDGMVLYLCHHVVQRDPEVYGPSANSFVPERWLNDLDTSMKSNTEYNPNEKSEKGRIPPSAWRPFERGPRNCIGQELANVEARVILACAVRRYDFTKVGMGSIKLDAKGQPSLDPFGQYVVEERLVTRREITSKPYDGTLVTVKMS